MTTATLTKTEASTATPAKVDFATLLTLTDIAMDVRLSSLAGVQEARQAASDAVTEADRYSDECRSLTVPEAPDSASVLRTAADLIRTRGWIQGDWTGEGGQVCTWRAVIEAAGDNPSRIEAAGHLLKLRIFEQTGERVYSIPFWNDRRNRTVGEVLSVLG